MASDNKMASPDCQPFEKVERAGFDAKTKISNLLKDKEKEWTAVAEREGPLRLLDLPMDVLKEIVKEVCAHQAVLSINLSNSGI